MGDLQNLRHQRRRWRASDDLRAAIGAASEAPGLYRDGDGGKRGHVYRF